MKKTTIFACLLATLATAGVARAQLPSSEPEVHFPFPEVPSVILEPQERLAYLLEHYWSCYHFADSTQSNRIVGEQGFADYVNLMQYADSAVCARSATMFVDSISAEAGRQHFFEELIAHYLGNPQSPLRNDIVYAHLLRALPPTPQRTFLLRQVEQNQVGTVANDLTITDGNGTSQRLYDIASPLTLLVFFDPECEHCQELMPQLTARTQRLSQTFPLQVLWVNVELTPEAHRSYYLPALPSLYLLDHKKTVLVKDGSIDAVEQMLQSASTIF